MERKAINKIKTAVANRAESRLAASNAAPHKLSLLFTIVNRQKAEFFTDFLQEYENYPVGLRHGKRRNAFRAGAYPHRQGGYSFDYTQRQNTCRACRFRGKIPHGTQRQRRCVYLTHDKHRRRGCLSIFEQ